MRRVALIAVIAGCSAPAAPVAPTAAPAPTIAETLWDRGTFITLDRDFVLPDVEESFEIYRTGGGYRIVARWQRPAPTGERADGEVTLDTDAQFRPLRGAMVTTIHAGRDEVTRSTITRELDGRLSTEVIAPDGTKTIAGSTKPNDWFIGGTITTFLVALCQADEGTTAPIIYPDKATQLDTFVPFAVEGRSVTTRKLVYAQSRREVIAVCEDGKLAGEVARGTVIVRKDDVALARALAATFR